MEQLLVDKSLYFWMYEICREFDDREVQDEKTTNDTVKT